MSRTLNNSVIGTQGCVYRHPTLRNLVRTNYWLDSMVNRPQSDVDRSISVGITGMSTLTFEQEMSWSVVPADTTTFVTSLAGVSGVHFNHFNLFSNSDGLIAENSLK